MTYDHHNLLAPTGFCYCGACRMKRAAQPVHALGGEGCVLGVRAETSKVRG